MALKAFLLNHWEHVPLCERRDDIPEALRAVFLLRVPNSTGVALIEDEDSRRYGQRTSYWTRTDGSVVESIDYQVVWAKQRAKEAFKPAEALVETY